MMGLMILGALAVYLLISIWATKKAASWAQANNKRPLVWGGLAAFVMYNLLFWDLIPAHIAHRYYCATQAEFTVYKTPEQWKKEHLRDYQQIMQGLDRSSIEGYRKYNLFLGKYFSHNDDNHFPWRKKVFHAIVEKETLLYDIDAAGNKTLMLRIKNFWRGKGGGTLAMGGSLDDIRQSLVLGGDRECKINGEKLYEDKYHTFNKQLDNWENVNDTNN